MLTLLLVIAVLFSGTLAWCDMNQHKTHKFTTTEVQNNVVLVEEFKEKIIGKKGKSNKNVFQFETDRTMITLKSIVLRMPTSELTSENIWAWTILRIHIQKKLR